MQILPLSGVHFNSNLTLFPFHYTLLTFPFSLYCSLPVQKLPNMAGNA